MIISRVELKNGRMFRGTSHHQFRAVDGYNIQINGCTLVVVHEDGAGIVLPVSDMSASYTEPGRAPAVAVPALTPTFETKSVDDSKPTDVTRVTRRPTKSNPNV